MSMNLRELVAKLECEGKPEHSEEPVMVRTPSGRIYRLADIQFEPVEHFEGLPSGTGGTVWIKVEEF